MTWGEFFLVVIASFGIGLIAGCMLYVMFLIG
jgi:hypothetical protein